MTKPGLSSQADDAVWFVEPVRTQLFFLVSSGHRQTADYYRNEAWKTAGRTVTDEIGKRLGVASPGVTAIEETVPVSEHRLCRLSAR